MWGYLPVGEVLAISGIFDGKRERGDSRKNKPSIARRKQQRRVKNKAARKARKGK